MPDLNYNYKIEEQRQKSYIKAYAVLCVIVLVLGGYFSYQKWHQYRAMVGGVGNNNALIETLVKDVAAEKISYDENKTDYENLNRQIESDVKLIFPDTDEYTELTRKIDAIEEQLNDPKNGNPFEISNLDFDAVKKTDNYSILPLRMNIRSSRDNFTKFQHMVETSGSMENKMRILDISSIRLNFENSGSDTETGNTQEIINFTVQINAYFK